MGSVPLEKRLRSLRPFPATPVWHTVRGRSCVTSKGPHQPLSGPVPPCSGASGLQGCETKRLLLRPLVSAACRASHTDHGSGLARGASSLEWWHWESHRGQLRRAAETTQGLAPLTGRWDSWLLSLSLLDPPAALEPAEKGPRKVPASASGDAPRLGKQQPGV